jgi:two-component system sensor histidine kinase HydH
MSEAPNVHGARHRCGIVVAMPSDPVAASYRTSLAARMTSSTSDRVISALIRVRMFMAPVFSTVALTFAFFEPTPWRRWLLGGLVLVLVTLTIAELIRFRRRGVTAVTVPLNLFVMIGVLVGLVTATGGLFSPLIPAFMVGSAIVGFVLGRSYLVPMLSLIILPAVWTFAAVHTSGLTSLLPVIYGSSGDFERGPTPWFVAAVYTIMIISMGRVAIALRAGMDDVFAQTIEERDRALALHAEQNRTLTTLTAEIAHELKNPLTSVKGLAALLAKDVEGKPAERLAVLRGEVDRMQGVLEEFLNFSRPLVPLAIAEIDLAELAREVVRLHEGSASERGVRLAVEGERTLLHADERKVRQIVMNLVQNALEASPDGSEIIVRVERGSRGAELAVLDRGSGIDPQIADRTFDAGVTTKDHGSGIGLAVARGLARQHGGDLSLEAREGGGCAALLTLPEGP